ncbi:DUF7319 domain-containing protein [Halorussus amylolyticus]|uniref:DUF7319 domain-containing protein n=1 Tax=Halorussus amylolyticus TaxID=1126242 RepID=UPI0010526265|nr:hypothetical protein [Halorussus amylolyticus]
MADPESESPRDDAQVSDEREVAASADARGEVDGRDEDDRETDESDGREEADRERLRQEVEEKYDFEEFGPREMAEMSYEEWDAAFDHDSWITGDELLDRVGRDLKSRVADRDVFAVVEYIEQDGETHLLAYSDEGYAVVYPDGTVEGRGTVLRDVKPSVALASMESYEVPDAPDGDVLPEPAEVPEGSGQLGNQLMQIIAAVHVLAGVSLLVLSVALALPVIAIVAGFGFLLFGVFVFLLVANARLSDRFRAEEYRNRLRAVGLEKGDHPEFLAEEGVEGVGDASGPSDDEN